MMLFRRSLPRLSQQKNGATTTTASASATCLKAIMPSQQTGKGDRVVVLGSGWGGFQLALSLDKRIPLTVISPRNHFVFTPLLPSTAVGTLESRCIQEPVRSILGPNGNFVMAKAMSLDATNKTILCESRNADSYHGIGDGRTGMQKVDEFMIEYDKLVVSVGVKTNTFGIQSIVERDDIYFLKQLHHAQAIRNNIVDSFEQASIPTVTDQERKRLLQFLVVGGGPTSCEFTAELHDFIKHDVTRLYPHLLPFVHITLVEAGPALLGPFDRALQEYAEGLFTKRDIDVRLGVAVTGVEDFEGEGYKFPAKRAMLSDGTVLEFGTMVWSAGLAPTSFTNSLDAVPGLQRHERNKRILVDEYCRVLGHEGSIWAIGDCAMNVKGAPLPQLAQVARQQGMYLGKVMNGKQREDEKPFQFFSLGSMAFMGDHKGIYDGSSFGPPKTSGGSSDGADEEDREKGGGMFSSITQHPKMTGFLALMLWRFAYWGRQTSVANKILIPVHWLKTYFFGRDTSRY